MTATTKDFSRKDAKALSAAACLKVLFCVFAPLREKSFTLLVSRCWLRRCNFVFPRESHREFLNEIERHGNEENCDRGGGQHADDYHRAENAPRRRARTGRNPKRRREAEEYNRNDTS